MLKHLSEFRRAKSVSIILELYITFNLVCDIKEITIKKTKKHHNHITCNISHSTLSKMKVKINLSCMT